MPIALPQVFGWLTGLLAAPVFYLWTTNGYTTGTKKLVSSLLLAGLGALLIQRLGVFFLSLTFVPLAFALFKSAYTKESASQSGGKGLATLVLTWLLFWGVYGSFTGINPYTHLLKFFDLGLQQTLELYSSKEAGLSPEIIFTLSQATEAMRERIPTLLPGLLLSMVTITVWINMLLINVLTSRLTGVAPWGKYTTWRLPDQLVWTPIVAIIALVLFDNGFVQNVGTWLVMITGLLYLFQGLAVAIALLDRWKVPFFVKMILYFVIIITSYGLLFIAVLGLIDVWFHFRTKNENNV